MLTMVPVAHVNATLPYLPSLVADMVQLQLATGMRSGELVIMRGIDIDTSGSVWLYRPSSHKTAHHGHQRIVALGPKAKEIVKRYLKTDINAYLFSPKDTMDAFRMAQRAARKTRVQPSQQNRKAKRPKKLPGERYTPTSYAQAIRDGCIKADQPRWTSHQLRHTAATLIQREFGIEGARCVLGHRSPMITALYAELATMKAGDIMAKMG